MTISRIVRGKGYASAVGGAVEGAVPAAVVLGLVGAGLEHVLPNAFALGVGLGLWLGASAGSFLRLRASGQDNAGRTALVVGLLAAVLVGVLRLAYVHGVRGPLLWLENGSELDSLEVAFAMLVLSIPALALAALFARFVARRHHAA